LNLDPTIRLLGDIEIGTLKTFLDQLDKAAHQNGPIVVEVTTPGGEADTARRIAAEVRLLRHVKHRQVVFLGKTIVYSAGVTIMASFAREDRYLTGDTRLLVHERRLTKTVDLSGPLWANLQRAKELVSELENGIAVEQAGFEELIRGSKVTMAQVVEHAKYNWYVTAQEAHGLGLIAGIV
jgi:ATP-dependent protease ClpP protease subunit